MRYKEELATRAALSAKKVSISPRLFVLAGIAGPILFVLVFTIDGFLRPGYSPIDQMISDLGLGPNAWIQNSNFVVFGLFLIAFAIGFYHQMQTIISKKSRTVSFMLLLLTGIGLANNGFFTKNIQIVHVPDFLIAFCSLIITFFIVGQQLRGTPCWRIYGWYTFITGLTTCGLLGAFIYVMDHGQAVGLLHRLLVVETFAWYVVTGYRLFVLKESEQQRLIPIDGSP